MAKLFMVTVPALDVRSDWAPLHDRLLDDFPEITDVLATTIAETLLIVYEGPADIDAWFDRISDVMLTRRVNVRRLAPASVSNSY
jgi:hypothetical protein